MSQLNNIVGKKIKTAYIRQKTGNNETQIFLLFPDSSCCMFSVENSKTTINYEQYPTELYNPEFKTIEKATFDEEGTRKRDTTELFHALWGQATTSLSYDKKKWQEMMSILLQAEMID